ncbi:hypothetical protein [Paucibacter soli]|uniref:hypothetical protein n=1 Tax=Paucibacter soli TaxID=3133433 RepID=UPI0030A25D3C
MNSIPRIIPAAPIESSDQQRDLFFSIELNARISGNSEVLMELDRIQGLLLGPANRVSEGAEEAAMQEGIDAIERILRNLELKASKQA